MSMNIKPSLEKSLPSSVTIPLRRMDAESQEVFEIEYLKERRNRIVFQVLAIFSPLCPIHFFLEGRIRSGIFFWITVGGFFYWWVFEVARIWSRTGRHNVELAEKILNEMKRPQKNRYSEDLKAEAVRLSEKTTPAKAAKKLGVSRQQIYAWRASSGNSTEK